MILKLSSSLSTIGEQSLYGQQSLETMPVDWHVGGFDYNSSVDYAYRILVKEIKPEYNFNKLPKNISWVQS